MDSNFDLFHGYGFCFQDIPRETLDHIDFKIISDLLELAPQFKQTLTQKGIYPSVILDEPECTAVIEADMSDYLSLQPVDHYTVDRWLTKTAKTIFWMETDPDDNAQLMLTNIMIEQADPDDGLAVILFHIMCEIARGLGFSKDLLCLDFDEFQLPCIFMPKQMPWEIPEEDRNITLDILLNQIMLPVLSVAGIPNTNTHLEPLCDVFSTMF